MQTRMESVQDNRTVTGLISRTCRLILVRLAQFLTSRIYRIERHSLECIPATGGALLVCNHISYMDAAVIQCCIPRQVHFLMYRGYYDKWWMKPFCRLLGVIPIASSDSPRALLTSLRTASDYINEGKLVCIFPEGALSRNGAITSFNRGIEVIMKRLEAPIVPLYLSGMWGTFLSYRDGKLIKRLPVFQRHPAILAATAPLPSETPAHAVRDAVMELGADTEIAISDRAPLVFRFIQQAKRHPFRFAMSDTSGHRLRYGPGCIATLVLARRLKKALADQRSVGILLPSSVAGALANLALNVLGKTSVNLNYSAGTDIVRKAMDRCGVRTVIASRRFIEHLGWSPAVKVLFIEDLLAAIKWTETASAILLCVLLPAKSILRQMSGSRSDTTIVPATILFSSGSTGIPKGVALSSANINANIDALRRVFHMRPEARILGALPFFHAYGLTATLWYPLGSGLGVIYNPNPFDFRASGNLIQQFKATLLPTTPTFLRGYMTKCEPDTLDSLVHVIVGAEKLPKGLSDAFEKKFGLRPREGYGCTELAPFASVNVPDYKGPEVQQTGTKSGTVGRAMPGVAVRIVNPESYVPLEPGQPGLLLIKGPNVMLGYWGDPEKTHTVMHDGWYVTGDIACIDSEGFLVITDRLSRFSKIGGEMVPHEKIEEAILQAMVPSVERICAVTAIPDARKGEKLIVLHAGEMDPDSVRKALQEDGMPNLWIPKTDAFVRVPQIPVLTTGKLDLHGLRTLALNAA